MEEASKQQLYPDQYTVSAQATPTQPVAAAMEIAWMHIHSFK